MSERSVSKRAQPRGRAAGQGRARASWQATLRVLQAAAGVFASLSVGWLLAEGIFHVTGRPPALPAYLLAVVLSVLTAGSIATLVGRIRGDGRDGRVMFDDVLATLDRIARGDFDIHLDSDHSPFAEVVESVNRMAEGLGTLEQQRQDFVSNVSHEIHSPLTSISGFATLLREPTLDEPTRQHYVDIIVSECTRLSGLSDNLLRLSALDTAEVVRTPFQLDEQLRDVILLLEPQWSGKEIALELEASPTTMSADSDLLRQVWINVLNNAIKFTPAHGNIAVRVATDPAGAVSVSVRDSGIGISTADLPHVFERFYRADKARGVGGNGLGLALVKRIVELHGGRVDVVSALGEGTTVTVHLEK